MAKLLIVEDDPALLTGLAELLSIAGHQVRATPSAQTALSAIETDQPELVISDVAMPDMTGPQLLDAVRACPEWATIPFLFISASITPKMERHIAQLDSVTYLPKPFEIDKLHKAIGYALQTASERASAG